jgi:hypothetical protein
VPDSERRILRDPPFRLLDPKTPSRKLFWSGHETPDHFRRSDDGSGS